MVVGRCSFLRGKFQQRPTALGRLFALIHHRFLDLRAHRIDARLQLAALCAATGSLVPDEWTQMTGVETAMELIRQCFTDRPLTAEEHLLLQRVRHFAYKMPALYLLCCDAEVRSSQLDFLYRCRQTASQTEVDATVMWLKMGRDEGFMTMATQYQRDKEFSDCHHR